jgi:hypothetical protein
VPIAITVVAPLGPVLIVLISSVSLGSTAQRHTSNTHQQEQAKDQGLRDFHSISFQVLPNIDVETRAPKTIKILSERDSRVSIFRAISHASLSI